MIVVMKDNASKNDIEKVVKRIEELGYKTHISRGTEITLIGIIGELNREELIDSLGAYPGIERLVPIQEPYKLAGKSFNDSRSRIKIGEDVVIGGKEVVMMAGPCAVESEQQIINTARAVKKAGAKILRGGAFKPRTSPYSFQGLHEKGLKYLKKSSRRDWFKGNNRSNGPQGC